MAFQSFAGLQGIGPSTLEALPSFSTVWSAPWKALSRPQSLSSTSSPPCASQKATLSTLTGRKSRSSLQKSQSPLSGPVNDVLSGVPSSRLGIKPSASALASTYSVSSIIRSAPSRTALSTSLPLSLPLSLQSHRNFSTRSRFGPFSLRPVQGLIPIRPFQSRGVANGQASHNVLAHLEQTANNNTGSASAQNAFYSALLRANMPDILVERYETGRYATNAACDAMYYRALERLGQAAPAGGATNYAGALPPPPQHQQQPQHGPMQQRSLGPEQLHAVSRAVVANQRGGSTATGRRGAAGETGEKSNPLHVVVDESMGSNIFKVVKFILIYGLVAYFGLVIITFVIETSGILRRVGGPQNSEVKAEQQKARFSDVQGCDEAKEELQEVADFLQSPEKYNKLGGKLPKGVLMVGPPGTGKTLLARAVAGEAGVPFFYMAGSEFDEVYVGVGAKRVRELFQAAKAKAPAIVFIDELDAVGGKRNERDAAYHMQTLNQMLTELDGFDQSTGVVFIGATNFPQMLDKALTRPGRFDRQIVVPLPDVRGRVAILQYHMRNMQIGTDVDASAIARGTPGFSGAELENLVNQAAIQASKQGNRRVSMFNLEWAKDRILMGAEKRSMVIQEKDKLMTAYHEAGHALVGLFTEGCDPFYKVTIVPRGMALGLTQFLADMDKHSQTKKELQAQIDMALGGLAAEELIYGNDNVTSGCRSDLNQATKIAHSMVTELGMSNVLGVAAFNGKFYETLSAQTKQKIEDEVRRMLDDGQNRARTLLRTRRKELDRLAQALVRYETLNKEEMERVIRGEELKEKKTEEESPPDVPIKLPDIPSLPTFPNPVGSGGAGGGTAASRSDETSSPSS